MQTLNARGQTKLKVSAGENGLLRSVPHGAEASRDGYHAKDQWLDSSFAPIDASHWCGHYVDECHRPFEDHVAYLQRDRYLQNGQRDDLGSGLQIAPEPIFLCQESCLGVSQDSKEWSSWLKWDERYLYFIDFYLRLEKFYQLDPKKLVQRL